MYLSDPIDTRAQPRTGSEPRYIQIQVGLSIASIRDAINRAARLKAYKAIDFLPSSWTAYEKHHRIKKPETLNTRVSLETVLFHCQTLSLVPANNECPPLYRPRNLYKHYLKEQDRHYELKIWTHPTEDLTFSLVT